MDIVRKSYRTQLADAVARISGEYKVHRYIDTVLCLVFVGLGLEVLSLCRVCQVVLLGWYVGVVVIHWQLR